jgi:nucleotide-binding universal stress UspA family protein
MTGIVARPTVLVGVGGTGGSGAVRWAAEEAARRAATLRLVRVLRPWQDRRGADAELSAAARVATAAAPGTPIEPAVVSGSPASTLIAESGTADLLVLGSRRRRSAPAGRLRPVLGGSAHCPIVVVPESHGHPGPELPVVVGVDGSTGDEAAIEFAFEAAAARDAVLVAVHTWLEHVVDDSPADLRSWELIAEEERAVLDARLARPAADHPDVVVDRICRCTSATRLLVELSRRAQLVVIGSHGHGRIAGHMVDAAAHGLARSAGCPWVVVRTVRSPAASGASLR